MRVVGNAKRVSVIAGGVLVVAAGLGLWQAALLLSEHETVRVAAFTAMFAVMVLIRGGIILF
jgi:uncharacterized membrane protein YiaA